MEYYMFDKNTYEKRVNLHKIDVANITRIFYIISAYFKMLYKRGIFYVV